MAHSLRSDGFDASEDGTGRGTPDSDATTTLIVSDPISANEGRTYSHEGRTYSHEGRTYSHEGRNNFRLHNVIPFDATNCLSGENVAGTIEAAQSKVNRGQGVIAFDETQITSPLNRSVPKPGDPSHPIPAHGRPPSLATVAFVRRLTPRECERLQGFPDDWTLVPYRGKQAADGPRYRAIGNSMATPVMRWIGERIALCERALSAREVAA